MKYSIKLLFCFLLISLCFSTTIFSQETYLPGYIVKFSGDTIKGQIDYRNWGINPKVISFKADEKEEILALSPIEISKFEVYNEIYESAIVQTDVSTLIVSKLNHNPNPELRTDTVFLQQLMGGEKNLYYLMNKEGRENFYIKNKDVFELLVYKKYLLERDGKDYKTENKKFIGQLAIFLNDCDKINSRLNTLKYMKSSMIMLYEYYNKCTKNNISYQKGIEKLAIESGIISGFSISKLEFSSNNFKYLSNANFSNSLNFSGGLFLDIVLPRNHQKWSLYNELLYTSYYTEGEYNDYKNDAYYYLHNTKIGFSYIKLNNILRYSYPYKKLNIFVNAGVANGFSIQETNSRSEEWKLYIDKGINQYKALESFRKIEQSFTLGSGCRYNKISIEVRCEIGNGMSNYRALKSTTSRYYFMLGYRFKSH